MHKNYKKLPPFLTAALCAMLLCSCAPASRAPQPTTAAPYEEESSADYEQLTESSLKEQQRFADFEENLFQDEISASRLDLHFLLKNPEEVRKDLHLTFTSTADELIRRGLENEREVDF